MFRELDDCIYYDEINRENELAFMIKHILSEMGFTKILTKGDIITPVELLTIHYLEFLCHNSDFRFEFPSNATELETAKKKLISKFSKLDLLYFTKDIICFFAIDGRSKTLVALSTELYLNDVNAQFTVLKIIINTVRIFKVILFIKPLQLGNSTINFFEDYVEKVVSASELYDFEEESNCVDTLKLMYELAKDHHGLVQVLKGPIFEAGWPGKYIIELKTRGIKRPLKD
ncbi:hypothetical protein G9A89_010489 [Geosiphon pyriformis]|nr:hypothetical protein G9A89_010489 [Geosiphon pyriformis]